MEFKISRKIEDLLRKDLELGDKIVVLFGARQTGKTTLAKELIKGFRGKVLSINCDEIKYHDVLSSRDLQKLSLLLEGNDLIFIDEAQRVPDIGINLKIVHDALPHLRLLVTGSSSFDLAASVREPLTGRTRSHTLYPMALTELSATINPTELKSRLEEFMNYGMYPGIFHFNAAEEKVRLLSELTSSYLYKDVLELSSIRNASRINGLLKALALQIGSEVSLAELGRGLGMSQETVASYIDLLEQSFILFRLSGFSRNLRKEITKRDKIYFWDLGVRNSLLGNHLPISSRSDAGALWENFIIAERRKMLAYTRQQASVYFWRTYTGAELDYVEERDGELYGYEIKLKKRRNTPPKAWVENYSSNYQCINIDDFRDFVICG
jgi:uncharacterized protein